MIDGVARTGEDARRYIDKMKWDGWPGCPTSRRICEKWECREVRVVWFESAGANGAVIGYKPR